MNNISKRDLGRILANALVCGKVVGSRECVPKFPSKQQIEQRTEPVNWMKAGMLLSLGLAAGAVLYTNHWKNKL